MALVYESLDQTGRDQKAATAASQSRRLRLGMIAAMAAAGAVPFLLPAQANYVADPELAFLMKAMAALKLAFVVPMAAMTWIRFGTPTPSLFAWGYGGMTVLSVLSLSLVFNLVSISPASVIFHAMLIGYVLLANFDDGFVDGLKRMLEARRQRRT